MHHGNTHCNRQLDSHTNRHAITDMAALAMHTTGAHTMTLLAGLCLEYKPYRSPLALGDFGPSRAQKGGVVLSGNMRKKPPHGLEVWVCVLSLSSRQVGVIEIWLCWSCDPSRHSLTSTMCSKRST